MKGSHGVAAAARVDSMCRRHCSLASLWKVAIDGSYSANAIDGVLRSHTSGVSRLLVVFSLSSDQLKLYTNSIQLLSRV